MAQPVTGVAHRRRGEAGFALLGVLLVTTLLVAITLGMSRHAVLDADAHQDSARGRTVRTLAGSGLVWVRQGLRADGGTRRVLSTAAGGTVTLGIAETAPDRRSITVKAEQGGRAHTERADASVYLTGGDALPTLTAAARRAVNASTALTRVTRNSAYRDTTINGILLLSQGVTLNLQDVVLNGCILDESVMWDAPRSIVAGTHIVVSGGLLIQPGSTLASCAVVASDTDISGDARIQADGVVVAHEIALTGLGPSYLRDTVLTRIPFAPPVGVDQPGAGRAPRAWPAALQAGSQAVRWLRFSRASPSATVQRAMMSYAFPTIQSIRSTTTVTVRGAVLR